MAKLYFKYGVMGSSKTANALMARYNYLEKGKNPLLLKPRLENRDGETIIRSRIGLEAECEFIEDNLPEFERLMNDGGEHTVYNAIIVDEAQFLTREQVDILSDIVDFLDIPVMCYGLRTDFRGLFFEGSARLMEIADSIEEIKTVCWCGKKALMNAWIRDGKIMKTGEKIMMGGNESYVSLCRKHYKMGVGWLIGTIGEC